MSGGKVGKVKFFVEAGVYLLGELLGGIGNDTGALEVCVCKHVVVGYAKASVVEGCQEFELDTGRLKCG